MCLINICCISFDSNYLVALIAFYGAVIAFFIPFTIDVSSKIKDRQGSKVISKKFDNEKVIKTLDRDLLINIFLASFVLLFNKESEPIWKLILNALTFCIFAYSIIILRKIYDYKETIIKYTSTDEIFAMLQEDIKTDKEIDYEKIDALTNTLVNSIMNKEDDRVSKNLNIFYNSIKNIFKELDIKLKEFLANKESHPSNNLEQNQKEFFNSTLELFEKCIKVGIENNRSNIVDIFINKFISLTYYLFDKYLLKIENKEEQKKLIELYFKKQKELFVYCLDNNIALSHSLGCYWYKNIVFDSLNKDKLFDLELLPLFDKQLFKYIKYAIDKNDKNFIKSWVRIFNSITDTGTYEFKLSSIKEFTNDFELNKEYEKIYSKRTYEEFIKKLENTKIIDEIKRKAQLVYLFHNIKVLLFSSFAYMLYKNSDNLLCDILKSTSNLKNSNVIDRGHNLLPNNITDIMKIWLNEENIDTLGNKEDWKFYFGVYWSMNEEYESLLTFILIMFLDLKLGNINELISISEETELKHLKYKNNYLLRELENPESISQFENLLKVIEQNPKCKFDKKQVLKIKQILNTVAKELEKK